MNTATVRLKNCRTTQPVSGLTNDDVIVETKRSQKNRARRLKRA